MKRYLPLVFFLFGFTTMLCGQGGYFSISNSYGTEPKLFKSIETSDGNILCVGKFEGNNPDMVRGFISKRSPVGAEIWTKTFGSGVNLSYYLVDEPVDILETRDSSYLLTCWSAHYTRNGDYSDGFYLVKLRSNGDTVFHKRYNGIPYWGPFSITETPNGNLYCAVNSCYYSIIPDSSFTQIISLDSNGNITGIKKYKSPFSTMTSDIIVDDNSIYLSGATNAPDSGAIQYINTYVIKLDTSGAVNWSRVYTCAADSFWLKKMIIKNGNIILAGRNINHPDNTLVLFVDSTGMPLSGKKIHQYRLIDVVLTNDSSLSWLVYSLDSIYSGCYLNRSNFNIDTISFSRLLDFNYSLQFELNPTHLSCTRDNSILAGAYYWSGTGNDSSVVLIKIDSLNNPGCPSSPGITSRLIIPVSVSWDTLSMQPAVPDLYNSFYAFPFNNEYDITMSTVTDLCNQVSVPEIVFLETSIIPNPFHSEAKLGKGNWETGNCVLKIYNSIGSLIRTEKISSPSSYILHRDNLPDGLYFFQLSTLDFNLIGFGKFIVE